jgi:HlyD family secretion protein
MRKEIAIAAVVVVAAGALVTSHTVRGRDVEPVPPLAGTVEADDIRVGSRLGGRVSQVLVREGDRVRAGQPLVRFEAADLAARRDDARAAIERARAELDKAVNGSRPEEIAAARAETESAAARAARATNGSRVEEIQHAEAQLAAADADLGVARATLDRIRDLAEVGVVSRQALDEADASFKRARGQRDAAAERVGLLRSGSRREEIDEARGDYERALARQRLVERGTRREDVASAKAELDRALAGLEKVEADAGELEVRAPADAVVELLQVRPGDLVAAGSSVATLVELDRLWVRVFVPEPQLGGVQLGDDVRVSGGAGTGETFAGRVEFVATQGEFTPRNVQTREERTHLVFAVRVRILEPGPFRPGMAAEVAL